MRKFFAIACIIVGVVTSVPVLLGWSIRGTLLQSEVWKAAFVEARVYSRALEELPAIALRNQENFGDAVVATPLSATDMAGIVQAVVPVTLLQDSVERSIDLAFALALGKMRWQDASLVIPLQDIKVRAPVEVQNILMKKVQGLPTCTDVQLKAYTARKDLNGALPPCKPKGVDVRALVAASVPMQELTQALPDSVDLVAEVQKATMKSQPCDAGKLQASALVNAQPCTAKDASQVVQQVQDISATILLFHLVLAIVSGIFFLATFSFFLPRLRSSFRWFGIGLMVAGAVNLTGVLNGRSQIDRPLTEPTDQLGQTLVNIFLPVAKNLAVQATQRYIVLASCVLILGAISFAVSFAWKPKPKV